MFYSFANIFFSKVRSNLFKNFFYFWVGKVRRKKRSIFWGEPTLPPCLSLFLSEEDASFDIDARTMSTSFLIVRRPSLLVRCPLPTPAHVIGGGATAAMAATSRRPERSRRSPGSSPQRAGGGPAPRTAAGCATLVAAPSLLGSTRDPRGRRGSSAAAAVLAEPSVSAGPGRWKRRWRPAQATPMIPHSVRR